MTHANLMNNYFNANSIYIKDDFRRRFRMRRHDLDKAGRPGFSPYQKVRMMAYGSPADSMDETLGMFESTYLDTLVEFCNTIVQLYKAKYLREPNQEDLDRLILKAEDRGFPGMVRPLDWMHWN
ncbi:uncharacterized protein LOC125471495 [Pyrus x bretschneideri]|uniref:uncharacterized protein LOC125471495 n=1 Tax=Pyrus x bretschneideri TaxID=225117 RepID=UPI00202E9705|nr:uncharacterized protein LOC125471495 [Pyrus x bretschneideri]